MAIDGGGGIGCYARISLDPALVVTEAVGVAGARSRGEAVECSGGRVLGEGIFGQLDITDAVFGSLKKGREN